MRMIIKDALVFKEYRGNSKATFNNPVEVTFNFSRNSPPIGKANLLEKEDGIYAEIELDAYSSLHVSSLNQIFPYVGGEIGDIFKINEVSLGPFPNQDETIPMIKPNQIVLMHEEVFPRYINEK